MNPSRNRKRGKQTERQVAKLLGGKRIGILGKDDVQTSDGIWSIEVKDRKASVVHGFMEQAVRNCPENRTPMVIVHKTNSNHDNDLVCIRLKDWKDYYGDING